MDTKRKESQKRTPVVLVFVLVAGKTRNKEKLKKREKKKKKKRLKKQRKQRTSGRFFSPTNNFRVGNYGLRRAERWDNMPSMSSEVIEI